jgi:hypothetical protein
MFPDFDSAKLLIHIAFHYSPGREQYLHQILSEIAIYGFQKIDVTIDTNDSATEDLSLDSYSPLAINIAVHDRLDDPFMLTWQHRQPMADRLDDYDYFMYVEDDILVPFRALQGWLADSRRLHNSNYRRGFLRTELTADNTLVSTDQRYKSTAAHFCLVAGRMWFYPENPYHAFWFYSRAQMDTFIESASWRDGNREDWGIRERAAAGMIWLDSDRHHSLVPVTGFGRVRDDALVAHLPNNYALDLEDEYGSQAVADLHKTGPGALLYRIALRLLAPFFRGSRAVIHRQPGNS